ncbi:hypothetical protein [Pseudomonas sp. S1(2024)]|uniref:hypothetical protein n=1 Tax=Pseudomonas sp. S1(2024) TaxID=3390191 RepID=UPI00397D42F1
MQLPDMLTPADIANLLHELDDRQNKLGWYLMARRSEAERIEFEADMPHFFQDLARALKHPALSGSLLIQERVTKLLKSNIDLVSSADPDTKPFIIKHLLNHFPMQLEILPLTRQLPVETGMRIAQSFIETAPLELCRPGDLASYTKMMSDNLSSEAFAMVAEHLLDYFARLESEQQAGVRSATRTMPHAPAFADTILRHYVTLFAEEMNMGNPYFKLLAKYQDQLVALRPTAKQAPSIHDINFIGSLYRNGLDKLATCLCIEWIKDYQGTDLIRMLEDEGFVVDQALLEQVHCELAGENYPLTYMNLNLLDYSLVRPNFDMHINASYFTSADVDRISVALLLNVPEDEHVLVRTGAFLDELCATVRGAKEHMAKTLKKSPYWRHSAALSEERLLGDLGL